MAKPVKGFVYANRDGMAQSSGSRRGSNKLVGEDPNADKEPLWFSLVRTAYTYGWHRGYPVSQLRTLETENGKEYDVSLMKQYSFEDDVHLVEGGIRKGGDWDWWWWFRGNDRYAWEYDYGSVPNGYASILRQDLNVPLSKEQKTPKMISGDKDSPYYDPRADKNNVGETDPKKKYDPRFDPNSTQFNQDVVGYNTEPVDFANDIGMSQLKLGRGLGVFPVDAFHAGAIERVCTLGMRYYMFSYQREVYSSDYSWSDSGYYTHWRIVTYWGRVDYFYKVLTPNGTFQFPHFGNFLEMLRIPFGSVDVMGTYLPDPADIPPPDPPASTVTEETVYSEPPPIPDPPDPDPDPDLDP